MEIIRMTDEGVILLIRAKPRAHRNAVVGVDPRGLVVAVRARPEAGAANAAIEETLAEWLGIPPSRVSIIGGGASRTKRALVRGVAESDVRARLDSVGYGEDIDRR